MNENMPYWLQVVSFVIAVIAVGVAVTFSIFKLATAIEYRYRLAEKLKVAEREVYNGQLDLVTKIGQDLSRLLAKVDATRGQSVEIMRNQLTILELVEENDKAANDRYAALRRLLEGLTQDVIRIENSAGQNHSEVMAGLDVVSKDMNDGFTVFDRNIRGSINNIDQGFRLNATEVRSTLLGIKELMELKNEETEGSPEGAKVLTDIELLHISLDVLGNSFFNNYSDRVAAELKKRGVDVVL